MLRYTLPILALTSTAIAAQDCTPEPGRCHTQDTCKKCYCLGPAEIIANAPVRPLTCDGDISITLAGLYWKADQDGMEYAYDTAVVVSDLTSSEDLQQPNNLIDAEYLSPDFKSDFGFKLGIGYSSPCDGWDVGVLWTHFNGRASSHVEAEQSDNHTLLTLWSAFQSAFGFSFPGVIVEDIETSWKLDLNLVDLTLGREFWASPRLSIRPNVGLRYASLHQSFHLEYKGGEFSRNSPFIPLLNDEVKLDQDFDGLGVLAGLGTSWHLGCGWSLYGNIAASLIYGRFDVDHDESIREAESPFTKTRILETEDHFRASRAILDLGLGIAYSTLVCDRKYGLSIQLGWEEHLFFHQNQMWRTERTTSGLIIFSFPNNQGENVHEQRRGHLGTRGLTLAFRFDF